MTAMAHRHGARVIVDGSAVPFPHMPIDAGSIDCDFFVFSANVKDMLAERVLALFMAKQTY